MNVSEITSERRARTVSWLGLVLQLLLASALLVLFAFNGSIATVAIARYTLGGVFIWMVMIILYHQRKEVAEEALETEQLRQERERGGTTTIFELDQEEFLVAQRRLRWMYRWLLPLFVLLTVAYLIGGHFLFWPDELNGDLRSPNWMELRYASLSMLFIAGIAFLAFLFSRYVNGMSRDPHYRMLKSGAIYMFGNSLACLAAIICLMFANAQMPVAERVLAHIVHWFMLVLGLEFLVNFILDFYRPRTADEALRPAFESRLLGLINEPGEIAKTIADAVNYQFGFEVSGTWFYQMLKRLVVPLVALAVLIMIGLSSIYVVDANERAFVERWGERLTDDPIGPGLHAKMPWPIDTVRKANVALIEQITIGDVKKEKDPNKRDTSRLETSTWTDEHAGIAYVDVLVANPEDNNIIETAITSREKQQNRDVPVSILWVSMPVQYRVKDTPEGFANYLYNFKDPGSMLRDIAYRELVKQAVTFDYQKIMAEDRSKATEQLHQGLQEQCDQLGLGLEIVFVGLHDVHPPSKSEVAATFQKVATAEQEKTALIEAAKVDYIQQLVSAAGNVHLAETVDSLSRLQEALDSGLESAKNLLQELQDEYCPSPEEDCNNLLIREFETIRSGLESSAQEARELIKQRIRVRMEGDPQESVVAVQGDAGEMIARARSVALKNISYWQGEATVFGLELTAYQASPRLYRMRRLLDAITGELDEIRKYVLMVDREHTSLVFESDEREASPMAIIENE